MAYIYKITNELNSKSYIGKTEKIHPLDRFYEHIKDSKSEYKGNRPLYRAFNKYGVENFSFEVIETVLSEESSSREIYWIATYQTYGSAGYNATKGGDGTAYLNYSKIIEDYNKMQDMSEVAKINNCHADSVSLILKAHNIETVSSHQVLTTKYGKKVAMLNIKTEKTIKMFDSQLAAARYLIEKEYSKTASAESLSSKISLVVRGKAKTCCGFKWKAI